MNTIVNINAQVLPYNFPASKEAKIKYHEFCRVVALDFSRIRLHLFKNQTNGAIGWYERQEELTSFRETINYSSYQKERVLNSCVLDFLLDNQHLIPEEWREDENGKGRDILFWGTTFLYPDDNSCVLGLGYHDRKWHKMHNWTDQDRLNEGEFSLLYAPIYQIT